MIFEDPRQLASLQKGDHPLADDQQNSKAVKELVKVIRDNVIAAYKQTETWRKDAIENYRFVEGAQWDEKELEWLKEERRPALRMNKVLPVIRLLSGIERQTREEMRVIPRKGSTVDDAALMTEVVKFIDDINFGRWERTRKSQDVYVCGRGFIKTDVSYDDNIDGDVVFRRVNPLSVFVDPLADSWDGSDWRWCAFTDWITEDDAKELWPEFADQIRIGDWLSGDAHALPADTVGDRLWKNKLFLDQQSKRVRIIEYWYKKYTTVTIAIHTETNEVAEADDEFMEAFEALPPEEQAKLEFVRRKVTQIWVATMMNWLLLQNKPSPYKHRMFPIIPYIGMQFYDEPMGLVEHLKDAQKFRNTAFSTMLNHLNRTGNSGWLNKANSGADPRQLEKFGSTPGVVINYLDDKPERIEPISLSQGHFTLIQDADREIQEISLINAEVQGITTQKTISGRAIEARQRGGLTANEDFFDNQLLGDKILGRQLIGLAQQFYDEDRLRQITDALVLQDPESPLAGIVNRVGEDDLIKTATRAEYDFIIGHAPVSQTIRQVNLNNLLQASQQFPGAIPLDAIIDLMDVPEQTKARIKQHAQTQGLIGGQVPGGGGQVSSGQPAGADPTGGPENAVEIAAQELQGQ